jgi:hypothetical protein
MMVSDAAGPSCHSRDPRSSPRRYRDWTHERILRETATVGDEAAAFVAIILMVGPAESIEPPLAGTPVVVRTTKTSVFGLALAVLPGTCT